MPDQKEERIGMDMLLREHKRTEYAKVQVGDVIRSHTSSFLGYVVHIGNKHPAINSIDGRILEVRIASNHDVSVTLYDWSNDHLYVFMAHNDVLASAAVRIVSSNVTPAPNADRSVPPAEKASKGLRYNEGKPRFDLIEPAALEMLAKVFSKGADKYEAHNWLKGMDWSKMDASLQRHLSAWRSGEDKDAETGLPHMAHVAWNAMALLSYEIHKLGKDDRVCHFINK